MIHRSTPGVFFGITSPHGIALLPTEIAALAADRVRQALDGGEDIAAVVSTLAEAVGGSLATLPPFAIAVVEGGAVRLAVRGALAASVSDASGTVEQVSGQESALLVERRVASASAVAFAAVGAPFPGGDAQVAPLGVVLCGAIAAAWDAAGEPAPGPDEDPGRTLAPEIEAFTARTDDGDSGFGPLWGAGDWETSDEPEDDEPVDAGLERAVPERAVSIPAAPERAVPKPAVPEPALPTPTSPARPAPRAPESPVLRSVPVAPVEPPLPETPTKDGLIVGIPDFARSRAGDDAPRPPQAPPAPKPPAPTAVPPIAPPPIAPPPAVAPGSPPSPSPSPPASPGAVSSSGEASGDHDGDTMTTGQLRELVVPGAGASGPEGDRPRRRGILKLSTGVQVDLDRGVVIGRRPTATRVTGDLPHLIAVPSPRQDISRNHLEVRLEGSFAVAVDLDSTNGTVLLRPGKEPHRIHPREATILVDGDVLDLGDDVLVAYEETS